jgi:hypothetical protein
MLERGDIVPYRLGDLVEKLKLREFIPAPRPIAPATYTPIKCPVTDFHVYARTALERAAGAIASAPNQQQNRTLNREAFGIGQLVAGRALPERMARTMLIAAARRMPNYDDRKWLLSRSKRSSTARSRCSRSPRVPK